MVQPSKRVTLDLTLPQHRKLRDAAKSSNINQQDLLALIIDLTLSSPETIKPHIERFVARKQAEERKQKDLERKAKDLISNLNEEQLEALLSGKLSL
ncbi:hypothetical protein [Shewanella glacialipiscicola]|uniref:hypothetical protein n=1 Tax=Shewanella glacialipiscicola TaxID=614069 RepID=UPI003D7BF5CD